jgi:death on curing protein
MLEISDVLTIHKRLIHEFGGTLGLRDMELLESAISRPYQTFDSNDLYPTAEEKASAIIESIVTNHPFVDGNKRTGYALFRILLLIEGKDINSSQQEKYEFVISIAERKLGYEEILKWTRSKITPTS